MKTTTMGILAFGAILVAGCGSPEVQTYEAPLLKPLPTCGAVEGALRKMAIEQMNKQLDQALEYAMQRQTLGCGGGRGWGYDTSYNGAPPPAGAKTSGSGSGSEGGASQVSTTNNQVAGVDEADFIKNDNKYIYVVAGQTLRILEVWPAKQSKELSKVSIEGEPQKLFVTKDRALVYSSLKKSSSSSKTGSPGYYPKQECTYGYNCSFTGDGNPTLITIFDISDRANPKKVRTLKLSGSYVNARRVGQAVYTMLSSPGITFPGLLYTPPGHKCGTKLLPWEIEQAFYSIRMDNIGLINNTPITDWMPSVEDTILTGGSAGTSKKLLAGCKGFYQSSIADGGQFTTILGLLINGQSTPSATTIVSRPGAVYASAKALYISVPRQQQSGYSWYRSVGSAKEASTVHKFKLSVKRAQVSYAASGVVKGRVLNQFSMDEHNDYLRIATTLGRVPSPDVHSTLSVLRHTGTALQTAGVVDKLAPKEDIRSVRFAGDRGYVVTFKKTDPLFVFDLSDPNHPRTMAELKIPGFSTYMHMMDKTHLMTIGYDANDQGSFAWFTGVRFQIFDVSNIKKPTLTHKMVIGTRGSSSTALSNHLAFNYFAPKNLLAVPMTVCEGTSGSGGSYGKNMTFSGLMVFDVTATGGFKLRGEVSHPAGKGITCSNWWTNAKSQVERSIIMDDYVFSASRATIKVNHLDNLSTDIKSLPIQ